MNLFGKRVGWSGKRSGEEVKTKSQRLSAAFLSPAYVLSVAVLVGAAMPAFKVPVDSFQEGALGTLTKYIWHTKAPDWHKRFGSAHWPQATHVQAWLAGFFQ
jgi:hypothetical protein